LATTTSSPPSATIRSTAPSSAATASIVPRSPLPAPISSPRRRDSNGSIDAGTAAAAASAGSSP
jgi:hypothetical protein